MRPSAGEVDPITLELINEGLIAIVREMRAVTMRTAYSSIIYEGQDFSCAITDGGGQLVAKAPADHPAHIVPVPWSVHTVLERFGTDIGPGDVFLHNDPYTGGTHLNDTATIYPVFLEARLFAFAVVRLHWGDIGGMTPGSISGQATEIYQEGLRIPPIRVHTSGRPDQSILDLIFANVRGERERKGDFATTIISCQQAARKVEAMAQRYGIDTLRACLTRLIDRAESRMREKLAAVPAGSYHYESYVESTGRALEPLRVSLTLTIGGGELTADLSGSSPQSDGPTNCGPAIAMAGVFVIVKSYLDPSGPMNQGAWKPLTVHAPPGSFLNAQLPAACGGTGEARHALDAAVMGALAAANPDGATADNKTPGSHLYIGGWDERRRRFIFYEYPAGGGAAWCGGDGNSAVRNFQEGDFTSIQPIEAVENEHPLLIERCEIRQDSAGAGRWRGGFGLRRDVRVVADEAQLSVLTDLNILAPHGICGGEASAGNLYTVRRGGQEMHPSPIPGKVTGFPLRRDDVVVVRTAGGGGYGDPLERPPDDVWQDVRQGYVSIEAAQVRYGVVVTADGVDGGATTRERAALRERRTFTVLIKWNAPEYEGGRRVLRVSRELAEGAGFGDGDVVELVPSVGAPLRGWARIVNEDGERVYLGPIGFSILRAKPGDRVRIRRLAAWGPPPLNG